jgi:hypothetical protein
MLTTIPPTLLTDQDSNSISDSVFRTCNTKLRWQGIKPGSTAWKTAMLTTIPPMLLTYYTTQLQGDLPTSLTHNNTQQHYTTASLVPFQGPKKSRFSGPTPSNVPRNDVAPLKIVMYRAIKTTGTLIVISCTGGTLLCTLHIASSQ